VLGLTRRTLVVASWLLATLGACQSYRTYRYREFTTVAEKFFSAAAAHEFGVVRRLSADTAAVAWAKQAGVRASGILLLREPPEPLRGFVSGDRAFIAYRIVHSDGTEAITVDYRRIEGNWKIARVDLSERR
jgi:hypothetical protein